MESTKTTHRVKLRVNDYVKVDLDIPSELDLSEFEAISKMVKTLGKIPSMSKAQSKVTKKAKKKTDWAIPDDVHKGPWKASEMEIIRKNYNPKVSAYQNAQDLADRKDLNRVAKQIYSKLKYMKSYNPKKFKQLSK